MLIGKVAFVALVSPAAVSSCSLSWYEAPILAPWSTYFMAIVGAPLRKSFIAWVIPATAVLVTHLVTLGTVVGVVPFAPAGPARAALIVPASMATASTATDFFMFPPGDH